MAKAFISEYTTIINDLEGKIVPVGNEPAAVTQVVTYTTSTQSSNLNPSTRFFRIVTDATGHFVIGSNPTATANSPFISAGAPEYFGVTRGQTLKIAFYDGIT